MKSPITGKTMVLNKESRTMTFRKEEFVVWYHFYQCEESSEQFTTSELDEVNVSQLYHQYRAKHNLPFPDEILSTREKYGLPATKMAEVLGFGINVYRQYESGEIPSQSNARLIQLAQDPEEFAKLLKLSAVYEGVDLEKKLKHVEHLIEQKKSVLNFDFEEYLLGDKRANEYTGFKIPNLNKFIEMVVYFTEKLQPYKTKMNKLLFYSDFLNFKQTCHSISGVRYVAIQMGPVPKNFGSLFDYAANKNDIDIIYETFDNGHTGEHFMVNSKRHFNAELFTEKELETLKTVAEKFKGTRTDKIVDISHDEIAWQHNVDGFNEISYKQGFELKYF
jgi:putative zinc finger/helix-turn-helix YgiT family protein